MITQLPDLTWNQPFQETYKIDYLESTECFVVISRFLASHSRKKTEGFIRSPTNARLNKLMSMIFKAYSPLSNYNSSDTHNL